MFERNILAAVTYSRQDAKPRGAQGNEDQESIDPSLQAMANAFSKALGTGTSNEQRRLDLARWLAAADNFAIAYAITGIWSYHALKAHFRNCLQVAGAFVELALFVFSYSESPE